MSAQSQEPQVDQGQVVDLAQHVDQAQAQTTNQANNTAQAANMNRSLFNVVASLVQTGAQKAAAMIPFKIGRTRALSNASSASDESVVSIGPTTPFEEEIDEPVIVTPSMYEQESPIIQPQDQVQDEPHPLKKSEKCKNIVLLRQLGEHPNLSKKDKVFAEEYLKVSVDLPAWIYKKYDLKCQFESRFEPESDFDSGSEYGDEGAIYFETGRFHGPPRRVQAA